MKNITFYFDFVSPYAYLAFEDLPQALMGLSYSVTYKPLLLAGLLKHYGQMGPVEIPGKREWTYRHVQWLANTKALPLDMPDHHPFNPLAILRLAVASSQNGCPNRFVCETILRHVWVGGQDAIDSLRLSALTDKVSPQRDPSSPEVKAQLKAHADEAIELGIFGVPTFKVDGKVFWGFDAIPMLRAYLEGASWFDGPQWDAVSEQRSGVASIR
jgi:2-hydroxychromene-2-carboxylate isomerase